MSQSRTELWWPRGLECYTISNAILVMLEVDGSNPGLAVLFRNFDSVKMAGSSSKNAMVN